MFTVFNAIVGSLHVFLDLLHLAFNSIMKPRISLCTRIHSSHPKPSPSWYLTSSYFCARNKPEKIPTVYVRFSHVLHTCDTVWCCGHSKSSLAGNTHLERSFEHLEYQSFHFRNMYQTHSFLSSIVPEAVLAWKPQQWSQSSIGRRYLLFRILIQVLPGSVSPVRVRKSQPLRK